MISNTRVLTDDSHAGDGKAYQFLAGQTEGVSSPVGSSAKGQGGFRMRTI